MQCFLCSQQVVYNHHAFNSDDQPTHSVQCEKRRQALARMVGLVYWLDRNGRGWGRVKPFAILEGGLLMAEDLETLDRYPVQPSDLKREYNLTRKQRLACGLTA